MSGAFPKKDAERYTRLSSSQIALLQLNGVGRSHDVYTPGDLMVLWIADLMSCIEFIQETQQILVLLKFKDKLYDCGETVHSAIKDKGDLPVYRFSFADRKYVCLSDQPDIFDLETGTMIQGIQLVPTETLTYNLTAVFCQKFQELDAHEHSDTNTDHE